MKTNQTKKLITLGLIFLPIAMVIALTLNDFRLDKKQLDRLGAATVLPDNSLIRPDKEPRPLPTLGFVDGQGQSRSMEEFRGKFVFLNIWATWCGPCRAEMPALDRLQAKLGGDDFQVVALSTDQGGRAVIEKFYEETGLKSLELYWDSQNQVAKNIQVPGTPTSFLLDRQGRVLGRRIGAEHWDSPEMINLVRGLINGR